MTERERLADLIDDWMQIEGSFNIGYLADYLLENGVIIPSIKVGTIIYTNEPFKDGIVRDGEIMALTVGGDSQVYSFVANFDPEPISGEFYFEDIGKTVFFSKEEAEKALKEQKK